MLPEPDEANEHTPQHCDHRSCANFFGCGDVKGIGIFREDIKDGAFDSRASDRLLHMDEVDQENLDNYLSARGRWRRKFLGQAASWGRLRQSTRGSPSLHKQVSLVQVASVNLMTVQGERM
jgi:hypothetical protein